MKQAVVKTDSSGFPALMCIIRLQRFRFHYNECMEYYAENQCISMLGMGTTGFWSGENSRLSDCMMTAVKEYGITVLDTAEMYGKGRSETALGRTIRQLERDRLFLVDKILPDNAKEHAFRRHLENSLTRLNTDRIDLYLLHWRGEADLAYVVSEMERAVSDGLIRYWGVSNFDVSDLEDLLAVRNGDRCYCNQIFFSVYERGCEYELLPFMRKHGILPMSYSSLGSDYHPHPDIHKNKEVMAVCESYGIAPEAMMLKMNVEHGFCTLFSTSSLSHLHANMADVPPAAFREFSEIISHAFPAPDHKYPLVKI